MCMYAPNPLHDIKVFFKAVLTNQFAFWSPKAYIRFTKETGRKSEEESVEHVGRYFLQCFADYFAELDIAPDDIQNFLKGKHLLEYGPGDILGMPLLMYAYGAEKIDCVDRFPLQKMSEFNLRVYTFLLDSLTADLQALARQALQNPYDLREGFRPECITYSINKKGLSGAFDSYDLIFSRAVLEHVNSLDETFLDMKHALKMGGIAIHRVDLSSHGLDRYTELDFLTWPDLLYHIMYSCKGVPNRHRITAYKDAIRRHDFRCKKLVPIRMVALDSVKKISAYLPERFRGVPDEELTCTDFWMIFTKECASSPN
ncbi:methyltransferase type 12 [Candidatus Moduliflexus flocculans]|uniref:Methyltransferase type 12 n=1 Tax=Candidatus Moduliflexus flocculans TaxID=1499966 RepID=A0A081BM01_9BACT|nr:methyltransferase type 12 [Candidatus Moduliflexus flocculans]